MRSSRQAASSEALLTTFGRIGLVLGWSSACSSTISVVVPIPTSGRPSSASDELEESAVADVQVVFLSSHGDSWPLQDGEVVVGAAASDLGSGGVWVAIRKAREHRAVPVSGALAAALASALGSGSLTLEELRKAGPRYQALGLAAARIWNANREALAHEAAARSRPVQEARESNPAINSSGITSGSISAIELSIDDAPIGSVVASKPDRGRVEAEVEDLPPAEPGQPAASSAVEEHIDELDLPPPYDGSKEERKFSDDSEE